MQSLLELASSATRLLQNIEEMHLELEHQSPGFVARGQAALSGYIFQNRRLDKAAPAITSGNG